MIRDIIIAAVNDLWSDYLLSTLLRITLFAFVPALFWRLLKFRIQEWLHPEEPREFPHWIPVLGHAISFFKDSHGTLTAAREYFGNTREPFIITIAGQKMYVLTSPEDVSEAYKNTEALTFDVFVHDIMVSFGASPSAIKKMWLYPQSGGAGYQSNVANPYQKCLAQLTRDFHHQQLHPGPKLDDIGVKFLKYINTSLQWNNIPGKSVHKDGTLSKVISLKQWCGDVLLEAATKAFFGNALLKLQPDLFRDFFTFDDNSWMLMYRYPRFLAKDMHKAKDAAINALTKYFELPRAKRQGEAWFVRTLELEQRSLGIGDRDIATLILMVYWVVNSNTYKLCFWVLAYLLNDKNILDTIREETRPALVGGEVDLPFLLQRSPRLNAVFDEVMRLTNSSSSIRRATSDVRIGRFQLHPGPNVLIPYRQLHFNEKVFGDDAQVFNPWRFLENRSLNRSSSYRPFGGGTTYCPGRFIARQEVLAFIAIAINRHIITLAEAKGDECFPALEEKKPCLGVMGPVNGDDIIIKITKKEKVI